MKRARILPVLVILFIAIVLPITALPSALYAIPYSVGDTGPGGGTVFSSLPNGQCKEAIAYNDSFFCNWDTALSTCEGATINLYDDWYLPNITELIQVYTNLHDQGLGNFSDILYWSSTAQNDFFAYPLNFSTGGSGPYSKGNEFYIIAVRSFMGDPQSAGSGEEEASEEPEIVWLRDHDMTCYQVWINEDNNFEFVFWWEYANNNWVQIYDMEGSLVFEIDMEKGNAHFEVALPDGMYNVKTFHEAGNTLQEFIIGKP